MKKIAILITFVLFGFGLNAQTVTTTKVEKVVPTVTKTEYNRWAISADFGNHMVADKYTTSTSEFGSFGGDIRYNVNPKFGIGLTAGGDVVNLVNDLKPETYKLNYVRTNFEAYVNVFNMVDIYSNRFTTLFHGGPGISFINSEKTKTLPNLRGGFTVLYRVTKRVSLKGDMSVTGNYGEPVNITGASNVESNSGVHSMIANASLGLSVSLGKHKKHIDNYVPEKVEPSYITYITTTTNIDTTIHNHYNKTIVTSNGQPDFVFFENDKYDIRESELNSIFRAYKTLIDNPSYTLLIKGLASPSEDLGLPVNSDNYNMTLSENRAKTVKDKLINMGISSDRITVKYFGKDKGFPKESVFDVARRVELIVVTDKK